MRKPLIMALAVLLLTTGTALAEIDELDMNKATVQEITQLEGGVISGELAQRIVSYRNANGPFKTAKDLLGIQGFAPELLDILNLQEADGTLKYEADQYVTLPTY